MGKSQRIKHIRGYLLINGFTIESFAQKYGFKRKTVEKVIERHWLLDNNPRGELTKEILMLLKKEAGLVRA